jgi:hypothetical protein
MYDQKQLQNDLCNIVWRYGERHERYIAELKGNTQNG